MRTLRALPLLFLLALCLCLLSGCGAKEDAASPAAGESELVYSASFTGVSWEGENSLEPMTFAPDGFYASCYEKLAEGEIPEGETPGYEGQYDTYGQRLYHVGFDGTVRPLAYECLPATEPGEDGRSASAYLQRLFTDADGSLLALEDRNVSWWDGPEGMEKTDPNYWDYFRSEAHLWLRRLDAEGRELAAAELQLPDPEQYLNSYGAVLDGQGRLWVSADESVYVFAEDGALQAAIELGTWTNALVVLSDGRVGAVVWERSGPELVLLDAEKKSAAERVTLEDYPQRIFPGSCGYGAFYVSGVRLYGYDLEEKTQTEIANLLDCDLGAETISLLRMEEDGTIRAVGGGDSGVSVATLRQVPRDSVAEKRVLTLGTLYPDEVSDAVVAFNRSHEDLRIEIRDYSQYNGDESEEAMVAGMTKLTTEIMAGSMPDLLALQQLPADQLAAKGLLEDLYPWIDADPELSREDFLPSVLQAAELDGGLYQASPGFVILTLIGAPQVVGDEPGWTFDEMEAALATMPEGCLVMDPYVTRDEALMMFLLTDLDSYVNWEDASCDFSNESFCKLLRFCAQFPAERGQAGDGMTSVGRISAGKQMCMDASIGSLDEIGFNDQYFGGSCTYIGYPCRSGNGNVIYLAGGYAMSAACADKDAAWEFLRSFLTAEHQRGQYMLPLRRDVLQEELAEEMRIDYEKDEEGHYRLDENGERIPISRGGMGMADENGNVVQFEYYGLSQEQADRFLAMLDGADKTVQFDMKIYGIVKEEAAAFFAGQKSAEEVAKLIQSKVGLYLSEQS
ncbi:MAG: extracellular solute-binding protein [Oscillospiraceae bacterium]|nr:extracellular solute-binding protein [Oscillospiraceae bacterium]